MTSKPVPSSPKSTAAYRSVEFRHFLQTIERATPAELELHLVLDNASTHKAVQLDPVLSAALSRIRLQRMFQLRIALSIQ